MIQIVGPQLNQWDTGRQITVSDTVATHAHFANHGDSRAVIMELVDGQSKVPDYLLQTGKNLCVYLVLNGVTQESKTFNVSKRERPENYVYDDDQRNYIYELIKDAEGAIESATSAAESATGAAQAANESSRIAELATENANAAATRAEEAAEKADDTIDGLEDFCKEKADGVYRKDTALVVQTYPVYESKVKVSASLPSGSTHLKLYCTGKKLFKAIWDKKSSDTMDEGYIYWPSGNTSNAGSSLRSRSIPVAHLIGKAINVAGAYVGGSNPGYSFYKSDGSYLTGANKGEFIVPEEAAGLRFSILKTNITVDGNLDLNLIQMETGLQSDIEEYKEIVFEPVAGDIDLEQVMLTGYNTIYAYAGTIDGGVFTPTEAVPVTVECLENPIAETWRLKETIARLHI